VRRRPPPTVDDICRALEQSAAESGLPVEFFARVIWQESRFDAQAVSPKGAAGIAQFMPATASWHGLVDPFGRKLAAAPTQFCFRAWLCKNSTRYNRTRNFGLYGHAESKKTQKVIFGSALRPNQISFSHMG